jgi:hypothetical protein
MRLGSQLAAVLFGQFDGAARIWILISAAQGGERGRAGVVGLQFRLGKPA